MNLPTEEDILAHLVLYAARPITTNADSTEQMMERAAWNAATAFEAPLNPVAILAHGRLVATGDVESAIADSERRLEVELRAAELIAQASAWQRVPGSPELIGALSDAVRTWRHALFALNPTARDGVR